MNTRLSVFVGCFVLMLPACGGPPTTQPEAFDPHKFVSFGVSKNPSDTKTKYEIATLVLAGEVMSYGVVQLPDKDPAPAFLLLVQLPPKNTVIPATSSGKEQVSSQLVFKDETYNILYKTDFVTTATGEKLTLDDKDYDLEAGRVFLIDLTEKPGRPVQYKAPLEPPFWNRIDESSLTKEKFTNALERFKEKHDNVQKFMDRK